MIVFGGLGASGRLNDVWVLEETQGRVVSVPSPSGPPTGTPPHEYVTGFSRSPWPNPARGSTAFTIALARPQRVEISLWDVSGRRVTTLQQGELDSGEHPFVWNGRTLAGEPAAAGLYFLRFEAGEVRQTRRVVLER